ncbi:MAG TPA: hypothetical protein PLD20_01770 [Blastocatellia bacterium]|nr:hypothetical protein [Blastocatellia bacterium]HMV87429.1 hypothetical protein [Blastocatellia bacterium]HMX24598.1 hypothetical protein [Blastocatellia bacterium]HMY73657.1 hypothetical protein [Blastocatellia bacterium]HMZ16664.1 hypothetical protein [Blastocatellia bacterium]
MAFTDFKTIAEVQEQFSIKYRAADFVRVTPVEISPALAEELLFVARYIDTRVSEFAIRETLIFPVLREAYKKYAEEFSLWSHRFIKYDERLVGTPDYFVSKRSELGKTVLGKPLLLMAEAKKNDFDEGWAQCLAEMVAAQKLNGSDLTIYGSVTDGQVWQFGKLERDVYTYNDKLFTLDELAELLGAWDYIFEKMQEQIRC